MEAVFSLFTPDEWSILGAIAGIVGTLLAVAGIVWAIWRFVVSVLWRRWFPKPETPKPVYIAPNPDAPELPDTKTPDRIIHGLPHLARAVRGREKDLEDLRKGLEDTGRAGIVNSGAVLQGQGGIGKTTLARYYVDRYGDHYDGIFWGVAETEADLANALRGLAPQLDVSLDNLPPVAAGRAIIAAMKQDGRNWLCVYDNVTGFDVIQNLLPDTHLIVTTRASAGWDGFSTLRADVLGYETEDGAAVQVLMEAAGREDDSAGARDLADALGGLPLALVVAGALIRAEGYGFAEYQDRIADVIAQQPKNDAYPDSVIGAVKLSYDALPQDARAVAAILSFWAPEGLTPDLLTGAPEGRAWDTRKKDLSEDTVALVSDPGRVRATVQALVDASLLIREGTADDPHEMHRMTGAALRALQAEDGAAMAATALLAAVYPYDSDVNANWPLCRRLTPHVRALWDSGHAPRNDAMGFLLNQAGVFLDQIADVDGGLALDEAGFEVTEDLYAEDHLNYAAGLHNLAFARMQAGDLQGARRGMARAVALKEAHRPDSAELAESHDAMGSVLLEMAMAGDAVQLPEAVRAYQRALALRRRLFGRRSEPVANSLNNLGAVRDAQGRGAAAARLYGASLTILRAVLPEDDTRLAYGAINVGSNWLRAGRADLAEPLLQEALEIWRAAYVEEPQHPELRLAAGWLIRCLLVRAAAGENAGLREMQARQLAEEFGFDWEERQAKARDYDYTPGPG